ncbi:MAG: ABC transporter ATP-binding protein, partial [Bacilli bacterium]|nr:ABC transporter ATP-binding protein [Bacilli bacterium]
EACKNVNFNVNEGEFIAIVGKSGSGKSTLMHLLGGLDNPTYGKVFINGMDIYSLKFDDLTKFRRDNIGFIYQFYNLIPVLTIKENILLPVFLSGKKVNWKYFDFLVKKLNLKDRLNFFPNELSGGGQQRCAIARAIINHPKIVLADEPTGNLDRRSSKNVIKLLKFFNKKYHQTIILVTHDEEVAREASRVIVYEDGEIKSDSVIGK